MLNTYDIRRDDMPTEMQSFLRTYPRDSWDEHPGFQDKTRQWLRAHEGFRYLSASVRKDTAAFLAKSMDVDNYAEPLAYQGNILIGNLHGHHSWEDHSYFPELSAADPRFDAGLEILEKDHADLDVVLDDFTSVAIGRSSCCTLMRQRRAMRRGSYTKRPKRSRRFLSGI